MKSMRFPLIELWQDATGLEERISPTKTRELSSKGRSWKCHNRVEWDSIDLVNSILSIKSVAWLVYVVR